MAQLESFDTTPRVKRNKLNVLPSNPEAASEEKAVGPGRFPSWLHRKLPAGSSLSKTGAILGKNRLHTVCEEARCPNLLECWTKKTATFLVLGKSCTRSCGFCSIDFTKSPAPEDKDEPKRVAESVKELELKHVVITMVARDDLLDGGASHVAKVIEEVRKIDSSTTLEVLTSDFCGKREALDVILAACPEVFNHNIETVRRLTPKVRHQATYERTLQVLRYVAENKKTDGLKVKSGLMVGLGEEESEVFETIADLSQAGCEMITIGQYLQPDRHKLRVKEFVTPEKFLTYERYGRSVGVKHMFAGPFVRSSYHAGVVFETAKENK